MKKKFFSMLLLVVVVVAFVLYGNASGLFDSRLKAPEPPVFVHDVPDDWVQAQIKRKADIKRHLAKHEIDYDHFANHPISQTTGIPLIILKLLPKVAPEFWGSNDNFLSVAGLFLDERLGAYPFPRGIGFTGLSRKKEDSAIDYASFTCGGCHIGRMRLDSGQYEYLDGGINSEFNVIGYRQRIVQTLNKIYGEETDADKKKQLVKDVFLNALEETHHQNPNYFYNNYTHKGRHFDADYEAMQIGLFKQTADEAIEGFIEHQESIYAGWKVITEKFYPNAQEQLNGGLAGMEDAIGFGAAKAYMGLRDSAVTKPLAFLALPLSHGVTDIMAVWDQDSHDARWNEDETRLINGGGQWNGHIPLPIYKNIAAQVALGFDDIDISVSVHSERLLKDLPPAIYPYQVDVALAEQGKLLFKENCAICHQPNNGKVYRNMGTDMGRAKTAGTAITVAAQLSFAADATCSPNTSLMLEGESEPVQPCATYRGVSLVDKGNLVMTPPRVQDGYNALPLPGLWAQAPYLHNGSVPTLYHLLVPSERPDAFVKSQLDYDRKHVGFNWQLADWEASGKPEGYVYDTTVSPALSNAGHDKDITQDGIRYKLDWSDDKEGLMALLEYLKTL